MSAYFRYPVKHGSSSTLTKDDTIYIVTTDGATITLPNPSDNYLIGKLFVIKVSVDIYTTPITINVASGVGNTLIDNSVSSIQIAEGYGSVSLICSTSPDGNTWFALGKWTNV